MDLNKKEEQLKKEGVKYDGGKLRYDLIPALALEEVVKVYTMGSMKYSDDNWMKGISYRRIFSAIMRHSWQWFRGEDIDPESGLNHMAHVAWGCLTLITYSKIRQDFDDRIKI